jgi:hypothetical protein
VAAWNVDFLVDNHMLASDPGMRSAVAVAKGTVALSDDLAFGPDSLAIDRIPNGWDSVSARPVDFEDLAKVDRRRILQMVNTHSRPRIL